MHADKKRVICGLSIRKPLIIEKADQTQSVLYAMIQLRCFVSSCAKGVLLCDRVFVVNCFLVVCYKRLEAG